MSIPIPEDNEIREAINQRIEQIGLTGAMANAYRESWMAWVNLEQTVKAALDDEAFKVFGGQQARNLNAAYERLAKSRKHFVGQMLGEIADELKRRQVEKKASAGKNPDLRK